MKNVFIIESENPYEDVGNYAFSKKEYAEIFLNDLSTRYARQWHGKNWRKMSKKERLESISSEKESYSIVKLKLKV